MADENHEPIVLPEDEPIDARHAAHLDERAQLIDAARESARTFDKAVLTFGSAIFGFSVAFLKDVAPHPAPDTLPWLASSWVCFSIGLLTILASFLLSQQACEFEITESANEAKASTYERKRNQWTTAAHVANVSCVVLLFLGLLFWSTFALKNLNRAQSAQLNTASREDRKEDIHEPERRDARKRAAQEVVHAPSHAPAITEEGSTIPATIKKGRE